MDQYRLDLYKQAVIEVKTEFALGQVAGTNLRSRVEAAYARLLSDVERYGNGAYVLSEKELKYYERTSRERGSDPYKF
jgi:hypothetical protein